MLHRVSMELTFLQLDIQAVILELAQHFFDVLMLFLIIWEYKDVIQVYNHADIEHVCEDHVDQGLEVGGGIGEPEGHH